MHFNFEFLTDIFALLLGCKFFSDPFQNNNAIHYFPIVLQVFGKQFSINLIFIYSMRDYRQ